VNERERERERESCSDLSEFVVVYATVGRSNQQMATTSDVGVQRPYRS